jgi:hypothetical protein
MSENETDKKVSARRNIYEANHFDEAGLESNRAGRLSASQTLNAFQVIGLLILMIIAAGFAIGYISRGAALINSGKFQQAFLPCGSSIVGFALVLFLSNAGGRIGMDRYLAKSPVDLIQKMLSVVDIIFGKVEVFEGSVSRGTEVETTYVKKSDGFTEPRRTTRYFYYGGKTAYRVSQDGYESFPGQTQKCRLYYLPSSGIIVNIEFIGSTVTNGKTQKT